MSQQQDGDGARWDLFQAAAEGALDWRHDVQAKRLLLAALGEVEQFGAQDARRLVTLQRLLDLAEGQGDAAEMEQWCRRVLQLQEELLGPHHSDFAGTLDRLARATGAQGKTAEAETLYQRRLTILEQTRGMESSEAVGGLIDLALHLQGQHRPAEEEALWRPAVSNVELVQGPEAPELLPLLSGLVDVYCTQARWDEAAALRRALSIAEHPGSPAASLIDAFIERLGEVYFAQGDAVAAEPLVWRALERIEAAEGKEEPGMAGKPWGVHTRAAPAGARRTPT